MRNAITKRVFLHRRKQSHKPDYAYYCFDSDMSEYDYILVGSQTLTFNIDEADLLEKEMANLMLKMNQISRESGRELEQIIVKIDALLAMKEAKDGQVKYFHCQASTRKDR